MFLTKDETDNTFFTDEIPVRTVKTKIKDEEEFIITDISNPGFDITDKLFYGEFPAEYDEKVVLDTIIRRDSYRKEVIIHPYFMYNILFEPEIFDSLMFSELTGRKLNYDPELWSEPMKNLFQQRDKTVLFLFNTKKFNLRAIYGYKNGSQALFGLFPVTNRWKPPVLIFLSVNPKLKRKTFFELKELFGKPPEGIRAKIRNILDGHRRRIR